MDQAHKFSLRFWGVRGSIACPGAEYVKYGGNTSCLEVRCGPHLLIFDAGTGMRPLGRELDKQGRVEGDVFFTHTHFDHITGLPFFSPAFKPENRFRFWAGHLLPEFRLYDVLCELMMAPLFPVPLDVLKADISYVDFKPRETLEPGPGIKIRTAPLNHPNGAIGYRIEYGGRAICYVTDTEHVPGKLAELVHEEIDPRAGAVPTVRPKTSWLTLGIRSVSFLAEVGQQPGECRAGPLFARGEHKIDQPVPLRLEHSESRRTT